MKRFFSSQWCIVIAIFLLALGIRVISLSSLPNGFHIDEVMTGYVGRLILLTGRDIYGNHWPLWYFNTFGDYRVIAPFYINGLSTFIFGVNIFAIRFPAALFGALIVFPMYTISKSIFGKNYFAYVPPLLLAVLPWHIILSRATSEGIMGLTVLLTGMAFLVASIQNKKMLHILVGTVLLAVTYFLYPSFRVLAPLSLIPFIFIASEKKKWYAIMLLLLLVLTYCVGNTVWGRGRFEQTSIFSGTTAQQVAARTQGLSFAEGPSHIVLAKIFDNKAVAYSNILLNNYLVYFSPQFLYGNERFPDRYVVPYFGLLFGALILLLTGLLLPRIKEENLSWYLACWYFLIIAPLPGMLTADDIPNLHRVLFMMIPFVLMGTYGLKRWLSLFKRWPVARNGFIVLCVIAGLGELVFFGHAYAVQSPSYRSEARNDGYIALVSYLKQAHENNIPLLISAQDSVAIYYLFFTNNFDQKYAGAFKGDVKIGQIDNMTFTDMWCPSTIYAKDPYKPPVTIVEYGDCKVPSTYKIEKVIMRKDSTTAFHVLTWQGLPPGAQN